MQVVNAVPECVVAHAMNTNTLTRRRVFAERQKPMRGISVAKKLIHRMILWRAN